MQPNLDLEAKFAAMPTHTIADREIFAIGTWTDSDGFEKEWTHADLDTIARNFKGTDEPIPLKAGHTSDAFNTKLANEMGLPQAALTGDEGQGAIRFGTLTNVRRDGDTLKADFDEVPQSIHELIQGGQYNQVSCEITLEDNEPRLTAVALLGAEQPAVGGMAPISMSRFTEHAGSPWVTMPFQTNGDSKLQAVRSWFNDLLGGPKPDSSTDGRPQKGWWDRAMAVAKQFPTLGDPAAFAGKVWFDGTPFPRALFDTPESSIAAVTQVSEWLQSQSSNPTNGGTAPMTMPTNGQPQDGATREHALRPEDLPALYEALELPDTATIEDVLAVIQTMKGGGGEEEGNPSDTGMIPGMEGMMTEFAKHPAFVTLTKQNAEMATELAGMRRDRTKLTFRHQAESWTGVSGSPDEIAEELTGILESAGQATVDRVVASYQRLHDSAVSSHLLDSIGSARATQSEIGDDEFGKSVEKYAEDQGITYEKALAFKAVQDPRGYSAHLQSVRQTLG